jgi:PKD repeat protein
MAGILAICAIVGATLLVPVTTTATTLKISVNTYPGGGSSDFNLLSTFPMTVSFSVNHGASGATFFWQFGDGTNSTDATPVHTYDSPCVYDIEAQMTASNGSVTSGGLVLAAFGSKGQHTSLCGGGCASAVCPPQGTAGLIPVELAGGFFGAGQEVNITMNGARLATVTADRGGDWVLNVSDFLTPEPNGTQYTFTTSPSSLTSKFTTLEGIAATPTSGAPGDSVTVEGRSYPPNSTVMIYLGGVSLGTAETYVNGSFLTGFTVPDVSPLAAAGSYPYTTLPQILGSQCNFVSAGSTVVVTPSSSWWWLLPVVIVIIVLGIAVVVLLLWRGRRRPEPPEGAE